MVTKLEDSPFQRKNEIVSSQKSRESKAVFRPGMRKSALIFLTLGLVLTVAHAQDNYEIQVYPADTVDPGATMLEFHTNFTFQGRKTVEDGVAPTNHVLHETFEITHGFTPWFETGFYVFTAAGAGNGWSYVGSHIRPRVRVPEKWNWPVGLSLSTEFGWVRPKFSADTWTWEIRPIIDKKIGRTYLSFNPTIEKSFRGVSENSGYEFSPNFKFAYDVVPQVSVGLEYYGALGPIGNLDPIAQQEQQILPAVDLNISPKWEINFGLGVGVTSSTDHMLFKFILGRRFGKAAAKD